MPTRWKIQVWKIQVRERDGKNLWRVQGEMEAKHVKLGALR